MNGCSSDRSERAAQQILLPIQFCVSINILIIIFQKAFYILWRCRFSVECDEIPFYSGGFVGVWRASERDRAGEKATGRKPNNVSKIKLLPYNGLFIDFVFFIFSVSLPLFIHSICLHRLIYFVIHTHTYLRKHSLRLGFVCIWKGEIKIYLTICLSNNDTTEWNGTNEWTCRFERMESVDTSNCAFFTWFGCQCVCVFFLSIIPDPSAMYCFCWCCINSESNSSHYYMLEYLKPIQIRYPSWVNYLNWIFSFCSLSRGLSNTRIHTMSLFSLFSRLFGPFCIVFFSLPRHNIDFQPLC